MEEEKSILNITINIWRVLYYAKYSCILCNVLKITFLIKVGIPIGFGLTGFLEFLFSYFFIFSYTYKHKNLNIKNTQKKKKQILNHLKYITKHIIISFISI